MHLHRNAKLGLAGRFSLVKAVEDGWSIREAGGRPGGGVDRGPGTPPWGRAGDGLLLVAPLAGGEPG
jgi:hypothetical protein